MITTWHTFKQKERSCHSVTEPGEQYMWCNHLIHVDGKVLTNVNGLKREY